MSALIIINLDILEETVLNRKDINSSSPSTLIYDLKSKATEIDPTQIHLRTMIQERIEEDRARPETTHNFVIELIRP